MRASLIARISLAVVLFCTGCATSGSASTVVTPENIEEIDRDFNVAIVKVPELVPFTSTHPRVITSVRELTAAGNWKRGPEFRFKLETKVKREDRDLVMAGFRVIKNGILWASSSVSPSWENDWAIYECVVSDSAIAESEVFFSAGDPKFQSADIWVFPMVKFLDPANALPLQRPADE